MMRDYQDVLKAGAAGLIGTLTMSAVMGLSRRLGLLFNPPPRTVTWRVTRILGTRGDLDQTSFTITWIAGHVAYGIGCGVLAGAARRALGQSSACLGALFVLVVWAVSYLGWLTAVGLYPWPKQSP